VNNEVLSDIYSDSVYKHIRPNC